MKKKLIAAFFSIVDWHEIDIDRKKEIYKDCIRQLEEKNGEKLCLCGLFRKHVGDFEMHKHFPEVYLQRPKYLKTFRQGLWFDIYNRPDRIKILKKALKKLGG